MQVRYSLGSVEDWRDVGNEWNQADFFSSLVDALGPGTETGDPSQYTQWTKDLMKWYDEYVHLTIYPIACI